MAHGAQDHWRYFQQTFPQAEEVLDFFHAAERLKEACDLAYGKDSDHGARRWHTLRGVLLNEPGGVDRVITALDDRRRHHALAVDKTLGDFRNNRHRMRDASFKARDLIIGSGLVEATNKLIVTQRMKGSGMIWGQSGGQAILSLRALVQSERFQHAWDMLRQHWQEIDPMTS